MIVTSLASYFVNEFLSKAMYGGPKGLRLRSALTHLVWITSAVSIVITFVASKHVALLQRSATGWRTRLWWVLSHHQLRHGGGRADPEFTKDLCQHQVRT
jgi:K(+)-stimulated pyrophosphate-energized sodium pump